jgi:predicted enzyme related to lactoylglutathione lyase
MDKSTNSLNWFEIPATDLERAKTFYQTIFDITLQDMVMGEDKMALFPMEGGSGKANGALAQSPNHIPSMQGSIVYLNANPAMDGVLAKVEHAGGKIAMPKTSIGPNGFIAFIMDTEGNRVGIHSNE